MERDRLTWPFLSDWCLLSSLQGRNEWIHIGDWVGRAGEQVASIRYHITRLPQVIHYTRGPPSFLRTSSDIAAAASYHGHKTGKMETSEKEKARRSCGLTVIIFFLFFFGF